MENHYYNAEHPLRPYTYSLPANPGTVAPTNAVRGEPPEVIGGHWPCWDGQAWRQVEDHRGMEGWLNGEPFTVNDLGALPDDWTVEPPEPAPEAIAAAEKAAAVMAADQLITARLQRQVVQTESFAPAEFAVFAKAGLFEEWAAGARYEAGCRLVHGGLVYEVIQDVTGQAHQPPDAAGVLAIYRPLSVDPESGGGAAGTLDDPIAFINGMDVSAGNYYSYNGRTYLAKADLIPCVWPPDTPGLWQWEVAGE